ncbi:ABC transporter permease [Enterococcus sp. AD013-P3]|uniref:ABC transporter permease n=1 Tax=Enterococcus sp. AD013-P3 TaxID=3411036 RepID=UPI003B92E308
MSLPLYFRFIKLYFRDKMGVFYSLMGAIVVIFLYFMFLANNQIAIVKEQAPQVGGKEASYLVHSLILAGLLSVTTVTSVLGAYSTMISDWEEHLMMDFRSSPLSRRAYPAASALSALTIGVLVSLLSFIVYQIGIYIGTGYLIPWDKGVLTLVLVLGTSLFSALLFGAVCSVIRSMRTYSGISLLIGSLIGFVNGLYVPVTTLAEPVQIGILFLPFIHLSSLYRSVLCEDPQKIVFTGAPPALIDEYRRMIGLDLTFNGREITTLTSICYLLIWAIIGGALFLASWGRKEKEI